MKFFIDANQIIKTTQVWLIIITVVAVITTSLISFFIPSPFLSILGSIMILTHIPADLAIIVWYVVADLMHEKPFLPSALLALTLSCIVIPLGLLISIFIIHSFFDPVLIDFFKKNIKIAAHIIIIFSLVVSIIASFVEYLRQKKRKLEDYILHIEQKELFIDDDSQKEDQLLVTEKEKHYLVDYSNIIYISSHGKKSLIHTIDRDYESIQLLKNTDEKLPHDIFIRIHKQFIVNKHFIKKIEPYTGGRYLIYLSDEDESTLTVGRTHVAELKEKLRLK